MTQTPFTTHVEKYKVFYILWAILLALIVGLKLYTSNISHTNTSDTTDSNTSPTQEITYKDYLKEQGVTDLSNKSRDDRVSYNSERSKHISEYINYQFIYNTEHQLFVIPITSQADFDQTKTLYLEKLKNKQLYLEWEKKAFTELPLTPQQAQVIKDKKIGVGDSIILGYKKDIENGTREISSIDKWSNTVLPTFKRLSFNDVLKSWPDNQYVFIKGPLSKVITKQEFSNIFSALTKQRQCTVDTLYPQSSVYKKSDSSYTYAYINDSCEWLFTIWYTTNDNTYLLNTIDLSNYYTPEDNEFIMNNYTKVKIETQNKDIIDKVYDKLKTERPYLFY